ncbi:MAG: peroxiredoxin family protein [Myxococcales bacterium]|nr:peroxiredoxin family protein [Myxococcales bacterium]
MGDLAKIETELSAEGIGVAAISTDDPEQSKALAEELGVGFPLLSDPGAAVINAYGVRMKGETMAVPATFVIRPDRTIAWQYIGEAVPDRPAVDVVRQEAQRLR